MSQKRSLLNNRYSLINEECILNQLPNDVLNILRDYWLHEDMLLDELGLNLRIHYNRKELYGKIRLFKILTNATSVRYNFDGKPQRCVDMNSKKIHFKKNIKHGTYTYVLFDYNLVDEGATDVSKKYLFYLH